MTQYPGFVPDRPADEERQIMEQMAEKEGWFHGWTEIPSINPQTQLPYIERNGVIEDSAGRLHAVPFYAFCFTDNVR